MVLGPAKFLSTGADFETVPLRLHAKFRSAVSINGWHGYQFFGRGVPKAMLCKEGFNNFLAVSQKKVVDHEVWMNCMHLHYTLTSHHLFELNWDPI